MQRAWLIPCVLAFAVTVNAAEVDNVLKEAFSAEAHHDSRRALVLFRRADALRPNDAIILQKISKQYSDSTSYTADPIEKRNLSTSALEYAQRAAALEPHSAVNVLSVGICYGKLALLSDTRTKLEYSRLVKQYAEQALVLDPGYAYAHHVLGRWNYEVATLGLGPRLMVKLIYGGLPAASTAEAVKELRRAVELAPTVPAHRVELGLALLADGQSVTAREILVQAVAMPTQEKYDDEAFVRARAALAKLR